MGNDRNGKRNRVSETIAFPNWVWEREGTCTKKTRNSNIETGETIEQNRGALPQSSLRPAVVGRGELLAKAFGVCNRPLNRTVAFKAAHFSNLCFISSPLYALRRHTYSSKSRLFLTAARLTVPRSPLWPFDVGCLPVNRTAPILSGFGSLLANSFGVDSLLANTLGVRLPSTEYAWPGNFTQPTISLPRWRYHSPPP